MSPFQKIDYKNQMVIHDLHKFLVHNLPDTDEGATPKYDLRRQQQVFLKKKQPQITIESTTNNNEESDDTYYVNNKNTKFETNVSMFDTAMKSPTGTI